MRLSKTIFSITCVLVFMFSSQTSTAQSGEKMDDFLIFVEKTNDGVKLKCVEGCAWTKLEFSLEKRTAQAVDAFGMMDKTNITKNNDPRLIDFQFEITTTSNGATLKGLKGTVWEELNFNLKVNTHKPFNRKGILKSM